MQGPVLKIPVESGFEGGHGSHWDAVIEDPGQLARIVSEAYKKGTVDEGVSVVLPEEGLHRLRVRALPLGTKAFEARVLELLMPGAEKPGVASVYPHLVETGPGLEGRPRRIVEWGHGAYEAQVNFDLARTEGEVTFFATDYHEFRAEYRSGEPATVGLSAVAYTSGVISPKQRLEALGEGQVDVSSTSIVAALKDSERAPYYEDDFFLQGPVVDCAGFAYPPWGEGAVLRLDLEGIGATPVFVRKKDYPHGWPRKGEFVAAYSWLQGRMVTGSG